MKKQTVGSFVQRVCVCFVLLLCVYAQAYAYSAQSAANWLAQFAQALEAFSPLNDPLKTADPARAGQYLLEYEFGSVLSKVSSNPSADDILEIDVRTSQVTDCRGKRVGMELAQALDGIPAAAWSMPLYVLGMQEDGYGWSWAYVGESGVYGVEYIAYGSSDASVKEYTLTYVIDRDMITAVRVRIADATLAQAQDGMQTAREIALRQENEVLAEPNTQQAFSQTDLQVMGGDALGVPVAQLIAGMGEPLEVQTLPQGNGRILVYDGAVVTLGLNEATGEEIVRGVNVSSPAIEGPRRLTVGMSAQDASALFRCDEGVTSRGGALYVDGEALGEAPYGEIKVLTGGEIMLIYACRLESGETALLEAGVQDGLIAYWHLVYESDAEGGV